MHTRYFWFYHLTGWLFTYTGILLSIYYSQLFTVSELYFGAALVGGACLYSAFTRWLYKRYFVHFSLAKQALYFFAQALIGATCATFVLISVVFLASYMHWIHPIPPGRAMYFIDQIFWLNALNMFIALTVWGALYMSIIRARALKQAQQELATSQLHSLIQQLNPHFLFNMLNNIRALILEDPNRARDALAQLSDMLRYSLNQFGMNKVSFAEELAIVEEYLSLCKIQFEHRLSCEVTVQQQVHDALIPRMLLQMCAENAIKHGVAKLKQGGVIKINAWVDNNVLQLEISNPIPANVQHESMTADAEGGVGIQNIKQRLALLYPKTQYQQQASIILHKDEQSQMATVTIALPFELNEE